jgi:2-amino-4-hydroxy-6-hydroxymethyldihydropteridine diphosphokinase
MTKVYLALGSNVGDKKGNIKKAINLLAKEIKDIKVGRLYISKAVGYEKQDDFINTAIEGRTNLSPKDLLDFCQNVEREVGRVYRFKWGPREIDIDILLYGNLTINENNLVIPHPYMLERDFVLKPLLDINPDLKDPITNKYIRDYLKEIKEKSIIGVLEEDFI